MLAENDKKDFYQKLDDALERPIAELKSDEIRSLANTPGAIDLQVLAPEAVDAAVGRGLVGAPAAARAHVHLAHLAGEAAWAPPPRASS